MKNLVVFCLALNIIHSNLEVGQCKPLKESDYWGEDKEICVKVLKLDREKIKHMDEQDVMTDNDPEFNMYAQCFFVRSGIQDPNTGEIQFDKIKQLLLQKLDESASFVQPEQLDSVKLLATNAVDNCSNALPHRSENPGQLAVRVGNCVMKNLMNVQS